MKQYLFNRNLLAAMLIGLPFVQGCGTRQADAAYARLQERGALAMGVDQYTSSHVFDSLEDGGRIEWQDDAGDADDVAAIQKHLRDIAAAFRQGDFRTPFFIHDGEVPGTRVMTAKRDAITYTYAPLPRGGEIRLATRDPEALHAIHDFMAFQRKDHRAAGHQH